MKITPELLHSWGIAAHPLGEGATPAQVAADESISLDDRLWVMANCLWHLDPTAARLFALECAESVAHLAGDEDDQAQFLGLCAEMREMAIAGVPDNDPRWAATRYATRYATWDATRYATWDAARSAARYDARDAARASALALASTSASTWDDTWDADLRKKIAAILEWLGDEAVNP